MSVDTGSVTLPRRAQGSQDQRPAPARRSLPRWALVWGAVFVSSWGGNQFSPLLLMYENREHYTSLLVNAFLGVYVLGLAPALLVAGSLSDRHGRKRVTLVGLGTAIVGSGLLAFGPLGPEFLLIGRLFSGATVGIAMAVGNSWIKELSQAPFDPRADRAAGARRASLSFTLGSGVGALVAGLIAQWGPAPEVLPFLIHIAVAVPFFFVVARVPESRSEPALAQARAAGPWWRQLRIPAASHRRFVRVVMVSCPWIFAGAAIAYGYLPTLLRASTGSWGLVFATTATVVALGVSSAFQPFARRVHSATSARGLSVMVLVIAAGIGLVIVSDVEQSIWVGLAANAVIGFGMGIGLVSGLLEVQRIAGPDGLAGLTGLFYAVAYAGFLAPAVIAAVASLVPVTAILGVVVALALVSWVLVMVSFRKHLPVA
ncbi:MFS transporter [Frondihabitans australicus]|uniref:Putative MFS family arabinose efflux permease n=1 Tax=Frondihabitans australicus TaxID=386892 RepID=A0A495IN66_9MICO|nr:MFS transporter [Frondihabitans australicus]RKR76631.1 putative MFS family arabinose efflux permease [Frondihabitans australicus]